MPVVTPDYMTPDERTEFSRLAAKKRWHSLTDDELRRMRELGVRYAMAVCKTRSRYPSGPAPERFWRMVKIGKEDSCWPWTGTKSKGYGCFNMGPKIIKSHRAAYIFTKGEIPPGYCVCHKCDNPSCCNPNHLFVGTTGDNTRDSVAKGRFVSTKKGETHVHSKLREKDVHFIRRSWPAMSQNQLARQIGVTRGAIAGVLTGKTWKHI